MLSRLLSLVLLALIPVEAGRRQALALLIERPTLCNKGVIR